MRVRNLFLLLVLAVALAFPGSVSAQRPVFPEVIELPDGWQPEGIVIGTGTTFYVGSLANGAIYRGDLRTGEGEVLVEGQQGSVSVGLDYDKRTGWLYVAGGPTGQARIYDGDTGELIDMVQLTTGGAFINDVTVTRDGAYFTNSFAPYLYRVTVSASGDASFEEIELSGEWQQTAAFNANGIVATPDERWLIVVHSGLAALFRVDPDTGEATTIDLGGVPMTNGDGLVLRGRTLFVVQNQINQISVIKLSKDWLSGEVVDVLMDDDFAVPTTADLFGGALYAVNAKFGTPPTPDTPYEVVRVDVK